MNKNKRKLNKLAIVNKRKSQRVASEVHYLSATWVREGDVFLTDSGYYLAFLGGHFRWLEPFDVDGSISQYRTTHDHWLGSSLPLVGINFSSLKEVAEVFL
ncbi:MAG: hypothetical protein [Caudoviricetes sp.]|nr:MAG: hypothetical protein [Caudoviricetes sp.]